MSANDPQRDFLRHTIAALAYRASRVLLEAPDGFSTARASESTRTAGQILAHLGDLFEWAVHLANGEQVWNVRPPAEWSDDVVRFFQGLEQLDAILASAKPLEFSPERLFQGPIADALTHIGQMAMLRRIAGSPMLGENYYKAEITLGRVGADQAEALL